LGNCKYCGQPAGVFRSQHAAREEQHLYRERVIQAGRQQISMEVVRAIENAGNFDALERSIAEIEQTSFVPTADRKALLVAGWETAVEHFLKVGILHAGEEKRLVEFKERFALSQGDLDKNGALTRTAKAAVLRDVLDGVVPQRRSVPGSLPINFQKGEQVVWAFSDSKYLEDKTRRQYVGGTQGVSIRVLKGVITEWVHSKAMLLNILSVFTLTLVGLSSLTRIFTSRGRERASGSHMRKSFRSSHSATVLA